MVRQPRGLHDGQIRYVNVRAGNERGVPQRDRRERTVAEDFHFHGCGPESAGRGCQYQDEQERADHVAKGIILRGFCHKEFKYYFIFVVL